MVRQRVHAVALGYEDLNDHDALRDDPVVQTACDRDESLASSSTLCRFEQRAERQWAIAIQHQLVERFIDSFTHRPRELVLDFDATDDPVHGHHPVGSSTGTTTGTAFCRCTCSAVSSCWSPTFDPRTSMHRSMPGRYCRCWSNGCERHGRVFASCSGRLGVLSAPDARLVRPKRCSVHRGVGPKRGSRTRGGGRVRGCPGRVREDRSEESVVPRLPVRRAQLAAHPAGHRPHRARAQGRNPRFVVTNLEGEANELYERVYCARGDMENRIKEQQLALFADRTSSSKCGRTSTGCCWPPWPTPCSRRCAAPRCGGRTWPGRNAKRFGCGC